MTDLQNINSNSSSQENCLEENLTSTNVSTKNEIKEKATTSNQSYVILSREDIVKLRKERNKLKKESKDKEREIKFYQEKYFKKSDKVKILGSEDFKKFQTFNHSVQQRRSTKIRKLDYFNILDFVITKTKNESKHKRFNINKKDLKFQINRGKKRQNKQKLIKSRLKKAIVRARIVKKEQHKIDSDSKIQNLNSQKLINDNASTSVVIPENIETNTITETAELKPILKDTICKLEELTLNENNQQKKSIHSRKFRSYCNNLTSPILRNLTETLIRKIYSFQKRAYEKNEIKAKAHRRYVVGFKETKRGLNTGKIKLVIIAPDCEECKDITDGIEDTIDWIKNKCNENEIPYLFSLRARQIAYCLFIKVPVYCFGIFSYDGVQDIYNELIKNLVIERENYLKIINSEVVEETSEESNVI